MDSKLDLFFKQYKLWKEKGDVVALRFTKTILNEMRADTKYHETLTKYYKMCEALDKLDPDNLDKNEIIKNVVNGFWNAFNIIKTVKPEHMSDEKTYLSTVEKYNYCREVCARLASIEGLEFSSFYKRFERSTFSRENGLNIPKE